MVYGTGANFKSKVASLTFKIIYFGHLVYAGSSSTPSFARYVMMRFYMDHVI